MVSALRGLAIVKWMACQLPKVRRHTCPVARPCSPCKTLLICLRARSSCGLIPIVRLICLCYLSISFQSSLLRFQTNGLSALKNGDSGLKLLQRCHIAAWGLCHYHRLDTWIRHGVSLAFRSGLWDGQIETSVIFDTCVSLSPKAFFASSQTP